MLPSASTTLGVPKLFSIAVFIAVTSEAVVPNVVAIPSTTVFMSANAAVGSGRAAISAYSPVGLPSASAGTPTASFII